MSEYINPQSRQDRAIQIFDEIGAVLEGHFVYAAGHHGNAYVAKDETIKRPDVLAELTEMMAENFTEVFYPDDVDVLLSAAPCGSIVASRMAEHIGNIWGKTPQLIFAEKVPTIVHDEAGQRIIEALTLKRGFGQDIEAKKVHLVEDIVNSGQTIRQLSSLALQYQGVELVGCSVEYNRTPSQVTGQSLGMDPWLPLVERELSKVEAQDCPQCDDLDQFPIRTDRGHGSAYLDEQIVN